MNVNKKSKSGGKGEFYLLKHKLIFILAVCNLANVILLVTEINYFIFKIHTYQNRGCKGVKT